MDDELAEAIAAGYEQWTVTGDRSVLDLFAADFLDNVSGRHVGNGFPRMAGMPVTNVVVAWPQLHVFLTKSGLVVEHRAVRDDFAMLEQLRQAVG